MDIYEIVPQCFIYNKCVWNDLIWINPCINLITRIFGSKLIFVLLRGKEEITKFQIIKYPRVGGIFETPCPISIPSPHNYLDSQWMSWFQILCGFIKMGHTLYPFWLLSNINRLHASWDLANLYYIEWWRKFLSQKFQLPMDEIVQNLVCGFIFRGSIILCGIPIFFFLVGLVNH